MLKYLRKERPLWAFAMEQQLREISKFLPLDNLVAKVQDAAREMGIAETVVLFSTSSWDFCRAYLREARFCTEGKNDKDQRKDIGYFVRVADIKYRFLYNPVVFSDEKLDQFLAALHQRKVLIEPESRVSTMRYTESDFRMAERHQNFRIYQ